MFRWLRNNNFINNDKIQRTHTLMSGGVIGIPEENYGTFLELYAEEVKMKHKSLTFSEMRSDPVFRMYFDVDILDSSVLDKKFAISMTTVIQDVLKSYYPTNHNEDDDIFQCVICSTKHKDVVNEGVDLKKNGFHLIFPNLLVDVEKALQMRYTITVELEKELGPRPKNCNIWSDVIDRAPYMNGLKMCGSVKKVKCVKCKKQDANFQENKKTLMDEIIKLRKKICPRPPGFDYGDISDINPEEYKDSEFGRLRGKYIELTGYNSCPICHNTGRHLEDRMYMPILVLDSSSSNNISLTEQLRLDTHEAIKKTSIRAMSADEQTPGYKRPNKFPVCPNETSGANLRNIGKKMIHLGTKLHGEVVNGDMFLDDASAICSWRGPQITNPKKVEMVQNLIQTSICSAYRDLQVKNIFKSSYTVPRSGSSGGSKLTNAIELANNGPSSKRIEVDIRENLLIRVTGKGSDHCMNKGEAHTNNLIYFMITNEFCHQMCFSRKDIIRSGGGTVCGKFKSTGVRISDSMREFLFSEEEVEEIDPISGEVIPSKKKHKKSKWDNLLL